MNIFGLKTCDTCRKARRSLPQATFLDVREDGVPAEVLTTAQGQFGDALVNKKSTTWQGLTEADRARPALELIAEHPTLMKRPLIVEGTEMTLGWSADIAARWGA